VFRARRRALDVSGSVAGFVALDCRGERLRFVIRDMAQPGPPVRPPLHSTGSFDFDGIRLTWASDRITSSRVDCPPEGIGRPCVTLHTGLTTIWTASAAGGRPRAVVMLRFEDVPG
jgi:hypothetical protein